MYWGFNRCQGYSVRENEKPKKSTTDNLLTPTRAPLPFRVYPAISLCTVLFVCAHPYSDLNLPHASAADWDALQATMEMLAVSSILYSSWLCLLAAAEGSVSEMSR